jgi:pimeloyl-ACP methyl ester carboxylesterase
VLVGLSMGGRNAMYFTAKRPEAVQKLVICGYRTEVSKRASQPSAGPPEPETWDSVEQAAQHLFRGNPYPGSTTTGGSRHQPQDAPDGRLIWAWHPSIKERRFTGEIDGGGC